MTIRQYDNGLALPELPDGYFFKVGSQEARTVMGARVFGIALYQRRYRSDEGFPLKVQSFDHGETDRCVWEDATAETLSAEAKRMADELARDLRIGETIQKLSGIYEPQVDFPRADKG